MTGTRPDDPATTATPVTRARLWSGRVGMALSILVLAWFCVRSSMPGGYTGWLVLSAAFALPFLGYWTLTMDHPRRARLFLSGAGTTAVLLGWAGAGFGQVPGHELSYRTPPVPAGWTETSTAYRLSPYMDGNGPTAQVVTYRVPGISKAEASAYVASLKADGWEQVDWDEYREICGGSRWELLCAIPSYGIIDAPWTHLTHNGITITIDPQRRACCTGLPGSEVGKHAVQVTTLPAD